MAKIIDEGFDFLIRIPKSWKTLVEMLETAPDENDFYFELDNKRYDFRAYRITLDTGEYEWLVSSLDAQTLSADEAKALYGKRWGIEGKYDFVKNKLQLENFSGKTVTAIKQEFYAAVYLANLCTAVTNVADATLENNDSKKNSNIPDKQTELGALTEL
jgi:IS4 transposase